MGRALAASALPGALLGGRGARGLGIAGALALEYWTDSCG